MPALKNPRHEIFAQGLAKGMSATAAYEAAGYKRNYGNVVRLKKGNEKVKARVAELQAPAIAEAELSAAWVIERFRRIAEACEGERPTAAIRALENLGKVIGIYAEDNAQRSALDLLDAKARRALLDALEAEGAGD